MRNAMKKTSHGRREQATDWRPSWRPSGPVKQILLNELRSGVAQTDLLERLVVDALGAKYPKLKARWQVLHEESNGKAVAA